MSRIRDSRRRLNAYARVAARDGDCCVWCSKRGEEEPLTLDHLVPYVHGGANRVLNFVLACETCNSVRGDLSVSEFIARQKAAGHKVREGVLRAALKRLDEVGDKALREWTPQSSRSSKPSRGARRRLSKRRLDERRAQEVQEVPALNTAIAAAFSKAGYGRPELGALEDAPARPEGGQAARPEL